jgi:hypothetical protein
MFSDSEVFVLGLLVAANKDANRPFYTTFGDIGRMLGFLTIEDAKVSSAGCIDDIPSDVVWGTGEHYDSDEQRLTFREMPADEAARVKAEQKIQFDDACRFIAERRDDLSASMLSDLEHGLQWFETLACAVGYSRQTPSVLYALTGTGEYRISRQIAEMPKGFARLLVERLARVSVVPLQWVMAVPTLANTMPDEALASLVPTMELELVTLGSDDPDERQAILHELLAESLNTQPETLGRTLSTMLTLVRAVLAHQHDHLNDYGTDKENTTEAAILKSESIKESPGRDNEVTVSTLGKLPDVVEFILNIQTRYRPDPSDRVADIWLDRNAIELSSADKFIRLASRAQELAKELHMPALELLMERLADDMKTYSVQCRHEAFYKRTSPHDSAVWATKDSEIQNAICLAYGDLLLRERYEPSPLPTGRAKAELLKQSENFRELVTRAVSHLRRDAAKSENCVAAMTNLAPLLEPLVRQAAAHYLRYAPSPKVADLLYRIFKESETRSAPEREEMEIVARVGMALHHAFRNDVTHNIAEIAGDWESAQFVAFGLLSMLNVLDRARSR